MNMIERVARAICEADNPFNYFDQESDSWRQKYFDAAAAAIKAMREPTEAMLNCDVETDPGGTQKTSGYLDYVSAGPLWRAMIDEALKE